MKKIIICTISVSLLLSAFFAVKSVASIDEVCLFNANVEALADGEDISAIVNCAGEGEIYCPLNNKAIYREVTMEQINP